jgi:hypothetical protein
VAAAKGDKTAAAFRICLATICLQKAEPAVAAADSPANRSVPRQTFEHRPAGADTERNFVFA